MPADTRPTPATDELLAELLTAIVNDDAAGEWARWAQRLLREDEPNDAAGTPDRRRPLSSTPETDSNAL